MKRTNTLLWQRVRDDSGQDLVEYALILALVSLGAIAGLNSLANTIANVPYELIQKFITAYTAQ